MFVRCSNSSSDILAAAHQTHADSNDATQNETSIDQKHSWETLICQRHQTILRLLSSAAMASTRWRVRELYCITTYVTHILTFKDSVHLCVSYYQNKQCLFPWIIAFVMIRQNIFCNFQTQFLILVTWHSSFLGLTSYSRILSENPKPRVSQLVLKVLAISGKYDVWLCLNLTHNNPIFSLTCNNYLLSAEFS